MIGRTRPVPRDRASGLEEAGRRRSLTLCLLLLAAVFFAGVAHLALLPPWEGFDEPAHWSSIQQIADTGRLPRYGEARISTDFEAYPGPLPYLAPYDVSGRPSYQRFAAAHGALGGGGPTRFTPGAAPNWQAQHGPTFYLLMAPVYAAARALPWVPHLFVLRLASWVVAFAGLALGVLAVWRERPDLAPKAAPIMAAWPFLFPQFFPEMARLGNDGLCLLLAALAWWALLRLERSERPVFANLALGATLGAGLLTKAFFWPITAGVGLYLAGRAALDRSVRAFVLAVLTVAVAVAVGGFWYVLNLLHTGSFTGADEFVRLQGQSPWATAAQNVTLAALARGYTVMIATFGWAGSWSLARAPLWVTVAPLALLAAATAGAAWRWRTLPRIAWAPPLMAAMLLAGLSYHLLVRMAVTGAAGGTPGWYLHVLAVPLAFTLALGWPARPWSALLIAGVAAATALAWTLQLALFSGCAAKSATTKAYVFAPGGCVVDLDALSAIALPGPGLAALAIAFSLLALAASRLARRS